MGKSRVLTLIEKINIIREYLRTKQTHGLAAMFSCHRGQVHHILKHKDEYLADWLATKDPSRTRRPRCKVLNALGLILYEWILRCSRYGITLSDEMIKMTSVEIGKILKYRLFKPNPKWYQRFKLKYKLHQVTDWSQWRPPNPGAAQQSLDLNDIINDLRAVHGESVIPNYVQLNDEEFKDLTVRCYGNENVAEALGELIYGPDDTSPVPIEAEVDMPLDHFGESSNSYGGYVSYSNDSESEVNCTTISSDNDNSNGIVEIITNTTQSIDEGINEMEAKPIENYREALNALGPLEQFALMKEDIRAVGLINQLEIIFQEHMKKEMEH